MSKVIQQVPISKDVCIVIIEFNEDSMEMVFRSSHEIVYRQTEKVEIREGKVYTRLYFFPQKFLSNFLINNED